MEESLLRFAIGGVVVSLFAILGDVFRPKSFAGLFGAAPSIALATLGLTVVKDGKVYAAVEARSMAILAASLPLPDRRRCRARSRPDRPPGGGQVWPVLQFSGRS